jgi:DNA-directed RNA polymerase subunit K
VEDLKYTRYERARMIGARALQIAMGAPYLLKLSKKQLEEIRYSPLTIAEMEFEKKVIPLKILREMPKSRQESQEQ